MSTPKGQVDKTTPIKKARNANFRWGWEINIAVRVDSETPGKHRFPGLAVAADLAHNSRIATGNGRENPIIQKWLLRSLRSDFFLFRPDRFVMSFANGPLVGLTGFEPATP